MKIIKPKIDKYLNSLLSDYPLVLRKLEDRAKKEDFPIIGPQVGNFLQVLAATVKAGRVLELGSGFGYSAIWFARGMADDGELILTDFNPEYKSEAEQNFKLSGAVQTMQFLTGDALKLLDEVPGPFDIIFNDIDKEFYPKVINRVYSLLRPGGLFITDNTLWYGRVTKKKGDRPTEAIKQFNRELKQHKGFITSQVPFRDGLSVCVKVA